MKLTNSLSSCIQKSICGIKSFISGGLSAIKNDWRLSFRFSSHDRCFKTLFFIQENLTIMKKRKMCSYFCMKHNNQGKQQIPMYFLDGTQQSVVETRNVKTPVNGAKRCAKSQAFLFHAQKDILRISTRIFAGYFSWN